MTLSREVRTARGRGFGERNSAGGSRTRRRPVRWLPEAALLLLAYATYSLIRDSVQGATSLAVARGVALLRVERNWHLDPEHALNGFLTHHPALGQVADYYYSTSHFLVTVVLLVVLYARAPRSARRFAAAWYAMNLVGLLGFWLYVLAPPRLLPHAGFVDTVVRLGTWGGWGSHAVASVSNQYAAMPSLHTGWAVWSAIAGWTLTRRWWLRAAAVLYPILTVLVVLSTANHYLLDTVAGVVTAAAGFAVAWTAEWGWRRLGAPRLVGPVLRYPPSVAGAAWRRLVTHPRPLRRDEAV